MSAVFQKQGHPTLALWNNTWWEYTGTHWDFCEEQRIKALLYTTLEHSFYTSKDGDQKAFNPDRAKIRNLIETLAVVAAEPMYHFKAAPAWLSTDYSTHDTGDLICMKNGILNWRTGELMEHTPALFTTYSLPFDYNPDARCPEWLEFLGNVFEHDAPGADLLQEYAGYLISGATNHHKALMLIGPRRGGKGTISRTLRQLVGDENTVSTSFTDLASKFGLYPLIGKPLAVIEDARADDNRRSNTLTERINNITGEDYVSIEGKGKDIVSMKLPTRFMVISNEVPAFFDASGAVVSRFLAVRLRKSFEGNEDRTLGARIAAELSGIFNWALAGYRRLQQQGRFTEPVTQGDVLEFMDGVASPLRLFFDEAGDYAASGEPDSYVPLSELYRRYKQWREDAGYAGSLNQTTFQRQLEAAFPGVFVKNTVVEGAARKRYVFGVRGLAPTRSV